MPFAGLIGSVPPLCPRLLINREAVGFIDQGNPPMMFGNVGLRCRLEDNYRDVFVQSDCDEAVRLANNCDFALSSCAFSGNFSGRGDFLGGLGLHKQNQLGGG